MTEQIINRSISDYEATYTASSFEVTQALYRKKLLLALLDKQKPRTILEVGCGLDTIANVWDGFEHLDIVEPGQVFAEQAKSDCANKRNVRVIQAFFEEALPDLTHQYDLILLSGLLHEVPNVQQILATALQCCHKNTVVHANVPNAKSFHRLLALEMGLIPTLYEQSQMQKELQQPRIFDLTILSEAMKSAGFEVIEQGSYFVKPFTHGQMDALAKTGFLTQAMLDGLWNIAKHFPENGSEIFVNAQRKA